MQDHLTSLRVMLGLCAEVEHLAGDNMFIQDARDRPRSCRAPGPSASPARMARVKVPALVWIACVAAHSRLHVQGALRGAARYRAAGSRMIGEDDGHGVTGELGDDPTIGMDQIDHRRQSSYSARRSALRRPDRPTAASASLIGVKPAISANMATTSNAAAIRQDFHQDDPG